MANSTAIKSNKSIMAHHIIGYPNLANSYQIIKQYTKSGIEILELQIPFSHPTADGATLTHANQVAVENGVSLNDCFVFYKTISQQNPDVPIIAMSYLNRLFSYGIEAFCVELSSCGVTQIIIPDLPFDSSIAQQITQQGLVELVPVIAPNITTERLQKVFDLKPSYVYLMSGFNTTGQAYQLHPNAMNVINLVKENTQAKIGIGFGISEGEQVKAVNAIADFAIVGSALKLAVDSGKLTEKLNDLLS